jgi:hypothetical protein
MHCKSFPPEEPREARTLSSLGVAAEATDL